MAEKPDGRKHDDDDREHDDDLHDVEVNAYPGMITSRRTAGTVTSLEIVFDDRKP